MDCIFLRRGYGTSGDGVNYVEYIQSSGTQYINTGFKPSNNTKIVTVVSDYPTTDASTTVWGTQSSSSDRYDFFITAGGAYRSYYYGASANFDSTISYDGKVTIERNATSIKIGDYSQTNTAKTFTCTTPLYIFAHNNNGSANKQATIKLYSCQIYESGVLVKDYMPCLDPDGVACLYDKVNKEYVYNAGSGTFTAGASISGGGSSSGGTTPKEYAVTLSGTFSSSYGYVTINGTKYTSAQTITVTEDTKVSIYVAGSRTNYDGLANVTLNGTKVQNGKGTYNHTVTSNCKITMSYSQSSYHAAITTS